MNECAVCGFPCRDVMCWECAELEVEHNCTGPGCRECREHNDEQEYEWSRHERPSR